MTRAALEQNLDPAAVDIMLGSVPGDEDALVRDTGVVWRPFSETLKDRSRGWGHVASQPVTRRRKVSSTPSPMRARQTLRSAPDNRRMVLEPAGDPSHLRQPLKTNHLRYAPRDLA